MKPAAAPGADKGAGTTRIRVIYGDTDMMGVAYYANYLRWFEAGRNEWIRGRGLTYRAVEARGFVLPVAAAQVSYHRSALYDDVLEIRTWCREVTRVRVAFEYEVWRVERGEDAERELLATGSTEHACVARDTMKPTRIPDDIAARLKGSA